MSQREKSLMDRRTFVAISATGLATLSIGGLSACGPKDQEAAPNEVPETSTTYSEGLYTGTGQGIGGELQVAVSFKEDHIDTIDLVSTQDTLGNAEQALDILSERIVNGQTLNVDTVSGATLSSLGILAAIADAVEQAGGDVNALKSAEKYPKVVPDDSRTKSADVVVIGSGMAGMTAANAAAQKGAKVMVIEKNDVVGGTSGLSGGGIAGSPDEADQPLYANELKTIAGLFPSSEFPVFDMIDALANKQAASHQWLNSLGVDAQYLYGSKHQYPIGVGSFRFQRVIMEAIGKSCILLMSLRNKAGR